MRNLKLMRCPFCNGNGEVVYKDRNYEYTDPNYFPLKSGTVRCRKCGLRLPKFFASAENAVEAWNRRYDG